MNYTHTLRDPVQPSFRQDPSTAAQRSKSKLDEEGCPHNILSCRPTMPTDHKGKRGFYQSGTPLCADSLASPRAPITRKVPAESRAPCCEAQAQGGRPVACLPTANPESVPEEVLGTSRVRPATQWLARGLGPLGKC